MSQPAFAFRSHHALERLLTFELRLICRTGLHIGAGKSSLLVGSDLPVMRDAAGRPLVPGSSLRGILRAGISAVAETLNLDAALGVDAAAAKPTGPGVEAAWVGWSLADRLFGRVALAKGEHSYSSRLQLSDLLLEAGEEEAVVVELRDGVGIERETRTAGNSVKYDLEVVPAGTRFRGRVRFKNPWDYEIGALAQALWMLDQGLLLLGGKSARGLGWMQVEVSPPQLRTAAEILARSVASAEPTQFGEVEQHFAPYLEKLETLRGAAAENRIAEEEAV